ncbi:hypothetical protein AMTRI_Chr07g78890 [Amborella trichopoda]
MSVLSVSVSKESEGSKLFGMRPQAIEIHRSPKLDASDDCSTPTSAEHKIPFLENCPPAPMKKPMIVKRKKDYVDAPFFILNFHEIEALFRPMRIVDFNHNSKRCCRHED